MCSKLLWQDFREAQNEHSSPLSVVGLWHIDASPSTPKRLALIDMRKIGPILGFYSTLHIGFDQWEVYTLSLTSVTALPNANTTTTWSLFNPRPGGRVGGWKGATRPAKRPRVESGVIRPSRLNANRTLLARAATSSHAMAHNDLHRLPLFRNPLYPGLCKGFYRTPSSVPEQGP